ncbi:hypothetical protein [Actinokineospora globicatena]|uniref:Excreted virulence factor EspC, type VII ESX diderm n=1 Tax=Actinokineospora globicatena TaxID=103729 RepID=A0A9W6QSD8_9PSEU|nr:hypothetical protein [Actinokineospora globicatena]MCP2301869.1 Protein of unknown function (DUF2580) [Actinokineospora globicatena]GLW76473.1 hypothetical protein Aglo01_09550 [Actinokineospora globicatena]GLW83308.1 hypothetical protein Aglo02_09480 [Actinokineospora globicatena]GLW94707.1 hypothetical protein Aglo03_55230 [Actinokineospora globicatena]
MAAIEVDPAWISGYATTVAAAADELGKGADVLRTAPLTPESFGSLGKSTRVTESYTRASDLLRSQLTRGVEALEAASAALSQIADKHQGSDDDGAQSIKRSGQG